MSLSSRDRLLKLREELEAVAATSDESAAVVELDQSKVGRLSRMDALQAQAMAKATGQRREAMLRNIEAALKRVDEDTYGQCHDCDEPLIKKAGKDLAELRAGPCGAPSRAPTQTRWRAPGPEPRTRFLERSFSTPRPRMGRMR